jgi:two-component sensor histidine kinase
MSPRAAHAEPRGLVGTVQEITERKERQERDKERQERDHLLMREINHRGKNMLGVVDAIALKKV